MLGQTATQQARETETGRNRERDLASDLPADRQPLVRALHQTLFAAARAVAGSIAQGGRIFTATAGTTGRPPQ